ncbi:hypothetical protein R3P38DRAFT_3231241 [Favolaschia claudopus]|uniref:Uncharacterized protein n=1 Tax=Favolaschia claudopus TaxID=2862362 RepID=A0AAV9ZKU9_9AGAR
MASSLFHACTSFRLGYSPLPQQPYPGRWTTPLIILFFAFLTSGLVCINIPLSAYEFIQELTYRPNDTIPALPMSNWLPSFLQIPKVSFTPQVLAVGSTIALNGSMFRFKILDAVDNSNKNEPVSTFAYSNNPFSEACDVISAAVLCHTPQTTFTCSLDMNTADSDPPILSSNPAEDMLAGMTSDFESALFDWIMVFDQPWNAEPEFNTEFWFACTVVANSTCHTSSVSGCPDNQPVRINQAPLNGACSADLSQPGSKNVWPEGTFSFTDSPEPYVPTYDNDSANALFPRYNNDTQLQLTMSMIVQNVYQTLFHTLRLELGVIPTFAPL